MSMWTLYFLVKLDSLVTFFGWIFGVSLFATLCFLGVYIINLLESGEGLNSEPTRITHKEKAEKMLPKLKKFSIITSIMFFTLLAVPTTKEIAFIYVVGNMSQAESTKRIGEEAIKIPEKALQILNYQLEEYMEQFKPKGISNK